MNSHIAYCKDENSIYFLSVINGQTITTTEIDNSCIMGYVTISRICGAHSQWTIVSLKDIVLQMKEQVSQKMQNKDWSQLKLINNTKHPKKRFELHVEDKVAFIEYILAT
jgi:hypothetical protein